MLSAAGPIVCAVDESDVARLAVRVAADLSIRLGLPLILVHAVASTAPPGASAAPDGQARVERAERKRADELLARVAVEEQLPPGDRRVLSGHPADAVVACARETDAAMVVVGSRGRGAIRSAVLGSVSDRVAAKARCPVLVVPE